MKTIPLTHFCNEIFIVEIFIVLIADWYASDVYFFYHMWWESVILYVICSIYLNGLTGFSLQAKTSGSWLRMASLSGSQLRFTPAPVLGA